jgi:hypothetical protein
MLEEFTEKDLRGQRGRWWVSIIVETKSGFLQFTDDPDLLAWTGKELYERLRSAYGYRFARVGFEVLQFNCVEALPRLLLSRGMSGLVVSRDLFRNLGEPPGFSRFSADYLWLPSDDKYV